VTFAAVPSVAQGQASAVQGSTVQASTGTYLTIRNFSGRAYTLTAASSPAARRARVRGHVVVPPHGSVSLSPLGNDIELASPRLPRPGQLVSLTLVFGQAGRVTIEATVTPPGLP
jgi:copper(I)-binding protein